MFFNKSTQYATLFFLLVLSMPLFSKQYIIGGKKGWSDIQTYNGITTKTGRFGNESLVLETNSLKKNEWTDLLLKFEKNENNSFDNTQNILDRQIVDSVGNYKVIKNNLFISDNAKMGKAAALSRGKNGGLILSGKDGSFFSTEGIAGSFQIEFWLCPSLVENGEIILNWRSSLQANNKIAYQLISATFFKDTVMWMFSNIFGDGDIILHGEKKLVPGKWTHHSLSFTEKDGLLSYKVDGATEDMKFITTTGHEGASVLHCLMGTKADLELCSKYTGLIDDFMVSRSYLGFDNANENEKHITFLPSGGRFESLPIFLNQGTIINSITAEITKPKETAVHFYIRGNDNHYNWTETTPEWQQVQSGEKIKNLSGTYFQIAADLFPDGKGEKTPAVSEIKINYSPLPLPQPPYKILARQGDGSVTLSWDYSVDDTTGGYYIYYGNRPGEYLGCDAVEGASPIDVGNKNEFTLTGLKNDKLYYFAVSAWSKVDKKINCPLSKEVYARPSK